MLKTVRMLSDHPPGTTGEAVVFAAGAVREVDPARCAYLVEHGLAEELPDGWTPPPEPLAAPEGGEEIATMAEPTTRRRRAGRGR